MDHLSFQNRIQVYGHHLSKSDAKLPHILSNIPSRHVWQASRELAMSTGTSNSTLTRFCQKLGYRNFIEFQTLLSAESAPRKVPGQVLQKIADYYNRVLSSASELVNPEDLDTFVSRIHRPIRSSSSVSAVPALRQRIQYAPGTDGVHIQRYDRHFSDESTEHSLLSKRSGHRGFQFRRNSGSRQRLPHR